jgi:hypothetical protein
MDAKEEKEIIDSIIRNRRLPYSIELLEVEGEKFTVRNNFGSTTTYVRKGEAFFLEDEI